MENIQYPLNPYFDKIFYSDVLELSDGTLQTEDGHSFHIHKIELVKHSKYFYRMFCGDIGKGKTKYCIPGVTGGVLDSILNFMYSGKVDITEANVCELLIAADYLLLDHLVMEIKNIYIRDNISVTNCLPLFLTALQIDRKDIERESFRFIQTHFETVVAVGDCHLKLLPLEVLEKFLGDKNLCVQNENAVWIAIAEWIEADRTNRQHLVPRLLKNIAISGVDEEMARRILEHAVVASNPFCEEMNAAKQCSPLQSNLDILKNYIPDRQTSESALNGRQTSHLHLIAHYCVHNQTDGVHIYATYDEKIDLWRKITEIAVCPDFILSIGNDIYVFAANANMRYSLVGKVWGAMPDFRVKRNYYVVVKLGGLMYVIGGLTVDFEEEMYKVEAFNRLEDIWYDVAPMMPVSSFSAVTVGGRIYVVGNSPHFLPLEMVAQAYVAEEDTWTYLQPPSVLRYNFAMVGYRNKLYVIGGRNDEDYVKDVEVFDAERNEWEATTQLPYCFFLTKAVVLNDTLIVYDNHIEDRSYLKTYPALQWDETKELWRAYEESSPINNLHKYYLFAPDGQECTHRMSRENKDAITEFSKSPFA